MTKKELSPLAKSYFDSSPDLKELFATEDSQFFYREFQTMKYCTRNHTKWHKFLRSDFEENKGGSDKLTPKQVLQKEAEELTIEFTDQNTAKELKTLITAKEESLKLEAIDLGIEYAEDITVKELFDLIVKAKED